MGLKVRSHQCHTHEDNQLLAGHGSSNADQDAIGLLTPLGTLLAHAQLSLSPHLQVLFCQATFQTLFPKPKLLHGFF